MKGVHFSPFEQKLSYERIRSFRDFEIVILQWKTHPEMNWREIWIV